MQGLVKSYGEVRALDGVDLDVREGTVLGLLGPNGAGKTTMIRVLTTLLKPDAGSASVAGLDVVRDAAELRGLIGLAGQYAAVDENLTGQENLTMVGRLYGMGRRDAGRRAGELLERFELAGRRTPGREGLLRRDAPAPGPRRRAGGRARRSCSSTSPPPALIPAAACSCGRRSRSWRREGATVLLTTQYLDEADRLAGAIAVIDHGRVIARGSPDELKDRVGGERLEVHLQEAAAHGPRRRGAELDGRRGALASTGSWCASPCGAGPGRSWRRCACSTTPGVGVQDIALRRPTLDDVFLALTGHAAEHEGAGEEQDA